MFVLALDTTTRRGSVALVRDGAIVEAASGDPAITHGQRLPGDLVALLERHRLAMRDIDLFAVAAGPGSFTGLRIGIATMQGLALANGKPIVGVSALDALRHVHSALSPQPSALTGDERSRELVVWMDAQRGEVFSARYRLDNLVEGPTVEQPAEILSRWAMRNGVQPAAISFAGEGALIYREAIERTLPSAIVLTETPLLAPSVAVLAVSALDRGVTASPDAINPVYVRRPDAVLARERKAGG